MSTFPPLVLLTTVALVFQGCASVSTTSDLEQPHHGSSLVTHVARANVFTASNQENASLDADDRGNVIVAWDSRRQRGGQYGVFARKLNAAGQPLTPEVPVGDSSRSGAMRPAVAATRDGGAWIAWTLLGADGDAGSIMLQRFDRDLMPLTPEQVVNTVTSGHQHDAAAAVDGRGRVLVTWTTPTDAPGHSVVRARLFDDHGAPLGDEFPLSDDAAGRVETLVALAGLRGTEGGFVAAWADRGAGGATSDILMRRIRTDGVAQGPVVAVNAAPGMHIEPSVDVDNQGRITIAWMRGDGEGHDVVARRFDASGMPLGGEFLVARAAGDWLSGVSVASAPDGRFVVSWNRQRAGETHDLSVVKRTYDAMGTPSGPAVAAHEAPNGLQYLTIASPARRSVWSVVDLVGLAWSGEGGLDDSSGVHVTLVAPAGLMAETPSRNLMARAAGASEGVVAPIPPIWDPNFKPLPPPLPDPHPGPDFGFLGVNFTGWTPPDPEIAVGPNHIVQMTNGAIAFFDLAGNLLFQDEIEDSFGFWGAQGATGFVFDPECLYDPHSGRFFAMACERGTGSRSYYLLAVSDDSNPMGTWHKYRIDVTHVDNDIDSPNMAVDADVVYLTADFFGPDKYQVLMIEKAPLLSGGAINSREFTLIGASEQSIGIPITYDATAPAQYMIQSAETNTPNGITFSEVRMHAIRNQLTNPTRVTFDVAVPTYSYPNQPPQQGTSNRPFLFEPRFWSCMYVNGSLWAVHHVNSTRARARWYEFRMNGWPQSGQNPTLRQWGELDYGGGIHTFFPSIAADAQGNAVIFFSRSSTSEFISIGRAFRRHDDPLNTFRPMEFVKESTSPYTAANRWGDYSHVEPTPGVMGEFWGTHEWTDVPNGWRTWIAKVKTSTLVAATLTGFNVVLGGHLGGGLAQLTESDDDYLRTKSGFGTTFTDLHQLRLNVTASTAVTNPTRLKVTIESRISHASGTARVFLRNRNTGNFENVGAYAIGQTDLVHEIDNLDASRYVNNGVITLQVRHNVVVPVFAFRFDSFFDEIRIEVE